MESNRMTFFDFLDDMPEPAVPAAPMGPLSVTRAGQGSSIPSAVKKRKKRFSINDVQPETPEDAGKLEMLGRLKGTNVNLDDLTQLGIKYQIKPSPAGGQNLNLQKPMVEKPPSFAEDTRTIRGDLGDIPRMLGPVGKGIAKVATDIATGNFQSRDQARWEEQKKYNELRNQFNETKPLVPPEATVNALPETTDLPIKSAVENSGVPMADFQKGIQDIAAKIGVDLDRPVELSI